jgi:hypothetical protein
MNNTDKAQFKSEFQESLPKLERFVNHIKDRFNNNL